MRILVTGGAGYIGSHAAKRLLLDGHEVVILDNLVRGHAAAVARLEALRPGALTFIRADAGDDAAVTALLGEGAPIDAVMHFAALAYVGESMSQPLRYHRNNTAQSLSLMERCACAGVSRFVFSSTCATYGEPPAERIPIREDCPQAPINPYGASKLHVERALWDWARACELDGAPMACAALRYFNVAGADREGALGEDHEPETHLIPLVLETAAGRRESLTIFGDDYATPDGTCVRDYVHVDDLIDAHVAVLWDLNPSGCGADRRAYNVGTGRGASVREVIEAAQRVTGRAVRCEVGPRRAGDPPALYADPSKIRRDLGWTPEARTLEPMIESAWRWMLEHPEGYRD